MGNEQKKTLIEKNWFIVLMLLFIPPVGVGILWYKRKWNVVLRGILTVYALFFLLVMFTPSNDDVVASVNTGDVVENISTDDAVANTDANAVSETELNTSDIEASESSAVDAATSTPSTPSTPESTPKPIQVSEPVTPKSSLINGVIKTEVVEDGIKVILESDIADGALIQFMIFNGQLDIYSAETTTKDGLATHTFTEVTDWDPCTYMATAILQFNSDEVSQPQSIKDIYGKYGELIESEYAIETTNVDGKNVNFETAELKYPNAQEYDEYLHTLFTDAMQELIDASNGIIVQISPSDISGWKIPYVYVSDAWYYSAEHEKERFAEQVAATIQNILHNTNMVDSDSSVSVYFYDTYGKELASPKMLGGYKIKR